MAAIWGIVNRQGTVSKEDAQKMKDSMSSFQIDRYESVTKETLHFACGHQYFTENAVTDVSPYYDEELNTYFLADVFLYNRDELMQELREGGICISGSEPERVGDAMLTYQAYRLWGEHFVEHLRGSFALVVYDAARKTILLCADHFARRYLTYHIGEEAVYFATVYQPLLAVLKKEEKGLSREWIVSAYTDCTADELRLPGKTVYDTVSQVEPAHYVKIDVESGKLEKVEYWNPLHSVQMRHGLSDAEYRDIFLATFESAVKSMLRARKETGIRLSGGLDSASVAAMAARNLAKENKKLFTYTAVPSEDFSYTNDRLQMENEKNAVLAQQKMYPNMVTNFVSTGDKNCFTELEEVVTKFQKPVKAALNMVNVEGMDTAAEKDGCSIIFTGQNGNATISYGRLLTYIYQKCLAGRFWDAYREMQCFSKVHRVSRKRILKVFWATFKEEKLDKLELGSDCLLKDSDIKTYNLLKKEREIRKSRGTGSLDSVKQRRGFCFMPIVFQHMGIYDTYSSLNHGMISLDPTLSVEMIELCMSMPIDCFVRGGRERRAVRDYMKGYVTDAVLENHSSRGVQAADYAHRVNRDWDEIKDKVYHVLQEPIVSEYLDEAKVAALIKEARENEYHMDKGLVARLAVVSSLAFFLKLSS